MVWGVNFRQIWAWMSIGSGFLGNWEKLAGVEATQDEVEEGLFGKAEERWTQMRRVVCRMRAPILRTDDVRFRFRACARDSRA